MNNLQLYKDGMELAEDEYLLKIRSDKTGFLSKLTKKREIPKSFNDWNEYSPLRILPIYIFKEDFNSGWKLKAWRFGQSQNWATVMHPDGFTLEIYLSHFLDIVKQNEMKDGEIIGFFKWKEHKLVKK